METKELLHVLMYKKEFNIRKISKELELDKSTVYKWLKNVNPRYKEEYYGLMKIIKGAGLDIKKDIKETKLILEKIARINPDEWKDLTLGLQEKLDVTQFQLLDKLNIKRDSHVSEWTNGKRLPNKRIKFKLLELAKKLYLDYKELIIFGRNIRQSLKIENKWVPADRTLRKKDFGISVLIKKDNKIYINSPLLFPEKRNKHDIEFVVDKGKIIIFYKEKRSTRPQPLILPRLLEINNDFLIGLGIYLGDGARNRHPKITNSEPLIINQGIKFFELFGISKANLKSWIQLHERSNKSFENVKRFWVQNTELNKENITKVRIKKSCGNGNIKEYGTLHLEVNFVLLQLLINNLLSLIPEILEQCSSEQIKCFLQGAFAAEGSAELRKSGSVREVNYCSTKDDERLLIKKLLNRLNISSFNDHSKKEIRVYGFDNFKKINEMDMFKYHPTRKGKLMAGFKNLDNNLKKRNGKH